MKIEEAAIFLGFGATHLANGMELTAENYHSETTGKSVFLKFFTPRCPHCQNVKPAWDQLMDKFADSKTELVAEVDCASEQGSRLCQEHKIHGYPTMKYGDPLSLKDYKGGRDFEALEKFAIENLQPICSPSNLEPCEHEQKEEIRRLMDMEDTKLDMLITEKEHAMDVMEEEFKTLVEDLQQQYHAALKKMDDKLDSIRDSGLNHMRAVLASKKKKAKLGAARMDTNNNGIKNEEEECGSCAVI